MAKSFILYTDIAPMLDLISDEDSGKLFRAVVKYATDGTRSELPQAAGVLFEAIRQNIDRNAKKYAKVSEKRRIAGRNHTGNQYTRRTKMEQNGTNGTDNDNDNDIKEISLTRDKEKTNGSSFLSPEDGIVNTDHAEQSRKEKVARKRKEPERGFIAPEVEEAETYFATIGGTRDDAESFCDHFAANGWKVAGKSPMKDWKAAARNWMRRKSDFETSKKPTQGNANRRGTEATATRPEDYEGKF